MKFYFTLFIAMYIAMNNYALAQNKQALNWDNISSLVHVRTEKTDFSADGQWFSSVMGPLKGNLKLILQHTSDTTKYVYNLGGYYSDLKFSPSSDYVGFYTFPDFKTMESNSKAKKPSYPRLWLINLKDSAKVYYDLVSNFEFSSNPNNPWVAIKIVDANKNTKVAGGGKGSDLILYNTKTKKQYAIGNVSTYSFSAKGDVIAYTIDANGAQGNGLYLMQLNNGVTHSLDVGRAEYSHLKWSDDGRALTGMKTTKVKNIGTQHDIILVRNNKESLWEVSVLVNIAKELGKGKAISPHFIPYLSKDKRFLFFGCIPKASSKSTDNIAAKSTAAGAQPPTAPAAADVSNVVIWNWQDTILQSQRKVMFAKGDKRSILYRYDTNTAKLSAIGDTTFKTIYLSPNQQFAVEVDKGPYDYEASMSGQSYADISVIDLIGGKTHLLKHKYYLTGSVGIKISPVGSHLVYYENGDYFSYDVKTKHTINLTSALSTTFVDNSRDHNVQSPPTPFIGWSADGRFVFIRDNYDLWKVNVSNSKSQRITPNFEESKLKVASWESIYVEDVGIDLSKDQYFLVRDERSKKSGVALLPSGSEKLELLFMDDAKYGSLRKSKLTNRYFLTRETSTDPRDVYTSADRRLSGLKRLTQNIPNRNKFAWSAGVRLIDYVSDHGDTLQAALFLPAGYKEGQSYPTITYIYERLSDGMNEFALPYYPGGGFNSSVYTSQGYAVLMPDIKYRLDDPGNSAVACVVPAVKSAIATGIVDADNVGLQGHSWGGYQTAFLITQSNLFKAASAGAPVTNLISMYNLIYWNTGGSNQAIFEANQARLTKPYWQMMDPYYNNSPVFHLEKINTPLLLMHNDKDGAVDYTQGIELYQGLRKLKKPSVLLSYPGENHNLAKEVNRKDYAERMLQYFDYFLKGKRAPTWWSKGLED